MIRKLLLIVSLFCVLFPSSFVYAATVHFRYYSSKDTLTFWANELTHGHMILELTLNGTGKGSIELSSGGSIPVTLNGSPKRFNVNAPGFNLKATSGEFWAVTCTTNNSLSDFVIFDGPDDGKGDGSVPVIKKEYLKDKDVYRIEYKNWPKGTYSYQLHFYAKDGKEYTSDMYTFSPTGRHYLTCNGRYYLEFFDSRGKKIASTPEIVTTEIVDPACRSYPDPTGQEDPPTEPGDGDGDGDGDNPGGEGPGKEPCTKCEDDKTPVGRCLQDIKSALGDVNSKLDGVNSRLDGVKNVLDDNLPDIKNNTQKILWELTSTSPYPAPGFPDTPDYRYLIDREKPKTQHQKFEYKDVKFKDNGDIESPGPFPLAPEPKDWEGQKQEPVMERDPVMKPDDVMKPDPVMRPDDVMKPDPVMRPDDVMKPDPVMRPDDVMKPDPVAKPDDVGQRDPVLNRDNVGQRDPVLNREAPMQQTPVDKTPPRWRQ